MEVRKIGVMEWWSNGVMRMRMIGHRKSGRTSLRSPILQHSNTPALHSSSGVTLVELLVVIVIIATLAAILTPVIIRALERADVAKAKSDMASIVTAIQAYYREYGIMPTLDTNGDPDYTFAGKEGGAPFTTINPKRQHTIMDILRGINTTNNPRRIIFLEVPDSSMTGTDRNNATYVPADGYYLDPWGNPYFIVMDTDFDDQIGGFNGVLPGALGPHIISISPHGTGTFPGLKVGVMSLGPSPGNTNSFIKSW